MIILLWGAELAAVLNENYDGMAAAKAQKVPASAAKPV
jgi:hypothetical protein